MDILHCSKCDKEILVNQEKCLNCGNIITTDKKVKKQVAGRIGRLVVSTLSLILFFVVIFESCAASLLNQLLDGGDGTSGSAGVYLGICMFLAALIGLIFRNSSKIAGPLVSAMVYFMGGVIGVMNYETYRGLVFWSVIMFIFSIFYFSAAIITKLKKII